MFLHGAIPSIMFANLFVKHHIPIRHTLYTYSQTFDCDRYTGALPSSIPLEGGAIVKHLSPPHGDIQTLHTLY